jgi:hypothetical protein
MVASMHFMITGWGNGVVWIEIFEKDMRKGGL